MSPDSDPSQAKIRSLLRSISILQKENIALKGSQSSGKGEAFKRVEAEMGRQDVIIAAFIEKLGEAQAKELVVKVREEC